MPKGLRPFFSRMGFAFLKLFNNKFQLDHVHTLLNFPIIADRIALVMRWPNYGVL